MFCIKIFFSLADGVFNILRKILDSKNTVDSTSTQQIIQISHNEPAVAYPQCPHCRRNYVDSRAVNRHIKKYCLKEKRFGCIFCQYRSKRKDHIIRHSIRVHDKLLKKKIIDGEFSAPADAVLKDGKLCEPENYNDLSFDASHFESAGFYPKIDEINESEIKRPTIKIEPNNSDFE